MFWIGKAVRESESGPLISDDPGRSFRLYLWNCRLTPNHLFTQNSKTAIVDFLYNSLKFSVSLLHTLFSFFLQELSLLQWLPNLPPPLLLPRLAAKASLGMLFDKSLHHGFCRSSNLNTKTSTTPTLIKSISVLRIVMVFKKLSLPNPIYSCRTKVLRSTYFGVTWTWKISHLSLFNWHQPRIKNK